MAESEWRPIEMAPEYTDILVSMTHNLPDGEWENIQWVDWKTEDGRWPIFENRIDIPFEPTEWMPLPEPSCK